MGQPTIRDVAEAAGVGVGTVSRVLTDHPRVADSTRRRVREAMERLNYRPSPAARALSRGRTGTIEVVAPLVTRHFYVEVLRGVETALAGTDHGLLVRTISREADREGMLDDLSRRRRADGALVISLDPNPELAERLVAARLPVVLVDGSHPAFDSVSVDHVAGAETAVRHLISLGHRRIAFIGRAQTPWSRETATPRQLGYRRALTAAGLALRAVYEQITNYSVEAGAGALDLLLDLAAPPTAVFVGSDTQAVGVLEAARLRRRRVPEDLAVVSYNDEEVAPYLGLTTIRVPMAEMGQRATSRLLARLANPALPLEQIRLPTELVIRRSCGARR